MVDPEVVASRIGKLRGYLEKLHTLAAIPQQEFLQDFTKVESTKHLLQVSIECCLDIAHHIVASEGYRTPTDYYDTFVVLHDHGILPADFMPRLRQMVRFRNRLVHMYWEVDDATMYRILQENLGDFETYIGHILDFIR
ncbi:MAG: DUF86 domain-containing protein [Anaerolineae bacterium]